MRFILGKIVALLILVNFCLLNTVSLFAAEKVYFSESASFNTISKESKTYQNPFLIAELEEEEEQQDGENNKFQKSFSDVGEAFFLSFRPFTLFDNTLGYTSIGELHHFGLSKHILYNVFLI